MAPKKMQTVVQKKAAPKKMAAADMAELGEWSKQHSDDEMDASDEEMWRSGESSEKGAMVNLLMEQKGRGKYEPNFSKTTFQEQT